MGVQTKQMNAMQAQPQCRNKETFILSLKMILEENHVLKCAIDRTVSFSASETFIYTYLQSIKLHFYRSILHPLHALHFTFYF